MQICHRVQNAAEPGVFELQRTSYVSRLTIFVLICVFAAIGEVSALF